MAELLTEEYTFGLGRLVLTPTRHAIATQLAERAWFRGTDPSLQHALLTLPEDPARRNDWNGLLADLAARPESIGGVTMLRMKELKAGNFAALMIFDVVNDAGTFYTYEMVSWKFGPMSGAKGIVFIRTNGRITHFVVLRGEKFATGMLEYDSVGGFAELGVDGVITIPELIANEIRQELGAMDLEVADVIDLGRHLVDPGMTNNRPGLFASIIDAGQVAKISRVPVNLDELELRAGPLVLPIRQLGDFFQEDEDAFFRAAVGMAVNQGIIAPRYLVARHPRFMAAAREDILLVFLDPYLNPSGFLDCQFQTSAHISSSVFSALQPSSFSAFLGSA
jgi:hypothetical protein